MYHLKPVLIPTNPKFTKFFFSYLKMYALQLKKIIKSPISPWQYKSLLTAIIHIATNQASAINTICLQRRSKLCRKGFFASAIQLWRLTLLPVWWTCTWESTPGCMTFRILYHPTKIFIIHNTQKYFRCSSEIMSTLCGEMFLNRNAILSKYLISLQSNKSEHS